MTQPSKVSTRNAVRTAVPGRMRHPVASRPHALAVAATAFIATLMAADAGAQSYPARTIRIVIPLAPGGGTDTLTRIVSPRVSQILGQQVIVENRAGGATQIGTDHVAKSAPDGYTLLNVDTAFATNPSLYAKLPYDAIKDFAPVSLLASATVVLAVHPSVPVHNMKQLLALARARPGELNFAVGGYGTGTHLSAELFKSVAKIDFLIVPYKGGGPAVAETVAGQVTMMFGGPASVKPHITSGRLRPIAVAGDKRIAALPNVPSFAEAGLKGVDSGSYWGTLAPAATPREIINTVSSALAKAVQSPDIHQRLSDLGYVPIGSTPEQYAENLRHEIAKWAKVVKDANIRIQ